MKQSGVVMFLLIGHLGCAGTTEVVPLAVPPARGVAPTQKWEYVCRKLRTTDTDLEALSTDLNSFGAEGWELVTVVPETRTIWSTSYQGVCFKRLVSVGR